MSRILILESREASAPCRTMLASLPHDLVVCEDREALLASMAERRPDLLVYVLDEPLVDVGVLSVIRRAAPGLPFILLGSPAGLDVRRNVQELRPTYYGVFPLDPSELIDAVRGALTQSARVRPTGAARTSTRGGSP